MRMLRRLVILIFLPVIVNLISFQPGYTQNVPFHKGVNLTNWFQSDGTRQIQFSKFSRTDFEQIKSLGCDVVRLPINLHYMTNGEPDYTVDPLFYSFLDQVVSWCEDLDINLILDNHTFDTTVATDPAVASVLIKVWTQMAEHYKSTSNRIFYEILNEPHGIADNIWNSIQQQVIDAIRAIDTKHTIIVGPAGYNSYNNLNQMPVFSDNNLIYTFHFYDPFLFTHQGASWADMTPVSGVPFPYSADRMPSCPSELNGTWIAGTFTNYKNDGNMANVKRLIDIAYNFGQQRGVPVYCGEFGVYDLNSPPDDRVYWYNIVRSYLDEKNIPWTIWDYKGSFGLFNKGSNELFDHDLNVPLLEALGLNVPAQTPYQMLPDSVGFNLYVDYIGSGIDGASYTSGELDYYSTTYPNSGNYCISWTGASQYQSVVFNFTPDKDLSYLLNNGYALSLLVRGNDPNGQFDIRFIDTKTGDPKDHPWRMRVTVSKNNVDWDSQWHKLYFPLSSFTEHGSWDNAWFDPKGEFDWTAVDKLEIATEYRAMGSYSLWVDDMAITNLDTSQVNTTINPDGVKLLGYQCSFAQIYYSPNNRLISISTSNDNSIQYRLIDQTGKVRGKGIFRNRISVDAGNLPDGVFFVCLFDEEKGQMVGKIVVY